MTTIAAYIDGFNLYYGMKRKYDRRYHWLDVVGLVRRLRPDDDVVAVRYFTTIVRGEAVASANQINYVNALRAHSGSVLRVRPEHTVILAMPPGNLQPHKRFADVGYFSINETALRRSQLPEQIYDPVSRKVRRRPEKWL